MRTFARTGATDAEMLLPWYAAGSLGRRARAQVEAALVRDPDLARDYDFVRDELTETIHLNESLGAPTRRAGERLMASLITEAPPTARKNAALARWHRRSGWLSKLSPRALKLSASMAALVFCSRPH